MLLLMHYVLLMLHEMLLLMLHEMRFYVFYETLILNGVYDDDEILTFI
jgi:hypothetical protein